MTRDELLPLLETKFPKVKKAEVEVKSYLTMKLNTSADLIPYVQFLKEELGFGYLDMITAVDFVGPVDGKGFVMDPNPNVFLPEGATPQVATPAKNPAFPYREIIEVVYCLSHLPQRASQQADKDRRQ